MDKKTKEITQKTRTDIEKKERKVEGALTFRSLSPKQTDDVKRKIDEIAEKNKLRIDIYQKKTPWVKGDDDEE